MFTLAAGDWGLGALFRRSSKEKILGILLILSKKNQEHPFRGRAQLRLVDYIGKLT
jgi:hypothetical protein